MRVRRVAAVTVVCFVSAVVSPVLAADAENKAIATDLFDKGVKLMDAYECDKDPKDVDECKQALDDFKRAYALYPSALGALRNSAFVEKGLGMVASAARDFREVARKAPLDPKPERQKWAGYANDEVKALEPRIPHLTIKVPSDRPAGMTVMLDGAPLLSAAWDTQIDVDPGVHSVRAEAPGRVRFDGTITLGEKQTKTIAVALEVDSTYVPPTTEAPKEPASRTLPWIVTSVGAVGVAAGLGLGYASMKKKDDACGGTKVCDPDGLSSGRSLANASTVVTSVGAAALVGGIVWLLLTPSSSSSSAPTTKDEPEKAAKITPVAGPSFFGVSAFGTF